MTENDNHIKIDKFFNKESQWKALYNELRSIIKETELNEDFKWMHPCYTLNGKNVVLIHGFKDYAALLFHKGVLMDDSEKILIQQTENVQAARQLRFTTTSDVTDHRETIKTYIMNAIEIEKSGRKIEMKPHESYELPEEMTVKFKEDAELEEAFYQLTPGRQRAYIMNISQAKQSSTRTARLEKYTSKILEGKGLNDR
ncbi:YdeI/OmpD-associated family protein [Macrococcus lamae]|uniref:YdhG-like domain-containing protein n=1 Tax=Macrococcus lamae TaxID=198484 RepID=A0A4R6BWM4_9STAP|nr:DUF1801 domain-containing protein [Macrococcus lamae]TDM12729.1 hypothetical protein ERX29_01620 [Macrococcus lamae]